MPYPQQYRPRYRAAAPTVSIMPDRRKRVWARILTNSSDLTNEHNYDLLSPFRTTAGITVNLPGVTIGRIRFKVSVHIDFSVVAASSSHGVVVGVYTQSQQSTTGRLNSAQDLVDDYLYWAWHPVTENKSLIAAGTATDQLFSFEVDSQAMRKMDEVGTGLFMNVSTTGSINMVESSIGGSVLLLLP